MTTPPANGDRIPIKKPILLRKYPRLFKIR